MSYRILAHESPAAAIKRISLEQLNRALSELCQYNDFDEAIHSARKRFKKIRGAARLVRDEVGGDVYKESNTIFGTPVAACPKCGIATCWILPVFVDIEIRFNDTG